MLSIENKIKIQTIFVFLSAMCVSGLAFSAGPGPDGNRGHLNRLLHNQNVITYLGLSNEQVHAAQSISNDVIEQHRENFDIAMAVEDRSERVQQVAQIFVTTNTITFDRLKNILSAEEHQRLKQIDIQTFGVRSFRRPEIISHLDLTQAQQEDLLVLAGDAGKQLAEISRSKTLSTDEKTTLARDIRSSALLTARQYLDETQLLKWDLLTGAEFSL